MTKKYDESAIQTMDPLSHIRLRSGMYIGRLGDGSHRDDGIYIMLKEVVDNCIDEFIMGHGDRVDISFDPEHQRVSIRDYGRGIPLGKVVDCVSKINTGAKYNNDVFQFSVGLNGVGTKAVNALSSHFCIRSIRGKKYIQAQFSQGKKIKESKGSTEEADGTFVEFIPDTEIFKKFSFRESTILERLWSYAYLNVGLALNFNGQTLKSQNGLLDLINKEVETEKIYEPIYFKSSKLEFAFLHTQNYGENYFSYVNGQSTTDGGSHLSAFKEGILKGVNDFAKKSYQGIDVRDGIVAAISVRVQDPVFESQTKNKLSNPELRSPIIQEVKEAVSQLLYKDEEVAKKLLERIAFNEKIRKELSTVKKQAREKQKKISFKIPKLRDCKYHANDGTEQAENSMIFLAEGDSAAASLVAARNPLTQAVFALRGKPLNVFGLKRDAAL